VNEFELIERYFAQQGMAREDVVLGIGDDAAVLQPPPGKQLVATTDTLVEGIHFFPDVDATALGYKALAVNVSDLSAMGAAPAWFLLSVTLPSIDKRWLAGFCEGLFAAAAETGMQLVGGNTTRGPLAITVQAFGFVDEGEAVRRMGAEPGDSIYVTGEVGDAALALQHRLGACALTDAQAREVQRRLERPAMRTRVGQKLRRFASSAIDISDGLLADLRHILEASGVGALVVCDRVPVSDVYRALVGTVGWDLALNGGDDYELCFTVPARHDAEFARWQSTFGCRVSCIGEIVSSAQLTVVDGTGQAYQPAQAGHDHFKK
jgi:thiamine-monophosphate kinase